MIAHISKLAAVSAFALALSGCTMGSFLGGDQEVRLAGVSASQAQIDQAAASAMPAIATECPPIRIRSGAGSYRVFANNRSSDPQALRYQGVIDDVSRNCVVSSGQITVQMGAAGRVILGPSGSPSNISVPLRFAVERDGVAVYSQRFDVQVAAQQAGANEFVHTLEGIAIPYVGGESITIWVGFDS
ncbi:hypothetical protein [Pelagibacterium lentulum]|nr:hypothetical protein [Pelagibacterium lentulum]